MPFVLLALFIGIPLLEIAVFIQIGGYVGLWPTLGIVVLTAVLGTALLQIQGFGTLRKAEAHMNKGELPIGEVVSGVFLLVAGALLLTPGFFTDAIGFALFVPAVRLALGKWILRSIMKSGSFHVYEFSATTDHHPHDPDRPRTIDGDYREID